STWERRAASGLISGGRWCRWRRRDRAGRTGDDVVYIKGTARTDRRRRRARRCGEGQRVAVVVRDGLGEAERVYPGNDEGEGKRSVGARRSGENDITESGGRDELCDRHRRSAAGRQSDALSKSNRTQDPAGRGDVRRADDGVHDPAAGVAGGVSE